MHLVARFLVLIVVRCRRFVREHIGKSMEWLGEAIYSYMLARIPIVITTHHSEGNCGFFFFNFSIFFLIVQTNNVKYQPPILKHNDK